ncbi:MAG: rhomboid family intramembrane serine protease [Bacteriovoracales bacterium]|nr:rhomboid family intramembrane serine protease [Bacteriovoracales bacterium]
MSPHQIYIPKLTPINKVIIIAAASSLVLQSLLSKITGFSAPALFGLFLPRLAEGHIYQLITYPLPQAGLMSTVFDGLVIWFIGSELESSWGRKFYIKFLITSLLSAAVFYLLFSLIIPSGFPLVGITGISYALLLSYGILYPDRTFVFMLIFPMKAKHFCLLIIGILFFSGIFSNNPSSWGHLGAVFGAFGQMVMTTLYRQKKRSFLTSFKKISKKTPHLHIVKDDTEEKDPKYWH